MNAGEDARIWADLKHQVTTIEGETIEYPSKLSLGKELKIRALMMERLSPMMDLFRGEDEIPDEKAFSFFMTEFFEVLIPIISIMIEKEEEWVKENIDSDTAQEIIGPFFKNFFSRSPLPGIDLGDLTKLTLQESSPKDKASQSRK